MHYITDKNGKTHSIEEYGWDDEKVTVCLDNYKVLILKMHYRHERTWDDHMGNTPCGYYCIVPIHVGNNKVERKRVYLDLWR
jgi:hypothetical protein